MGVPARVLEEERSAPPLALVSTAYIVGYRRPLSDLPQDKQEQIRKAYADTDWASEYSIEIVGVYTSYTLAKRAMRKPGHFLLSAPVNTSLPEANGRYGIQEHLSDNADWYEESSPGLVHLPESQVIEMIQVLARVMKLASAP